MANKNYSDMKPDELMHYGRKGMKWGQNIFGKKEKSSGERSSKKTKWGKSSRVDLDNLVNNYKTATEENKRYFQKEANRCKKIYDDLTKNGINSKYLSDETRVDVRNGNLNAKRVVDSELEYYKRQHKWSLDEVKYYDKALRTLNKIDFTKEYDYVRDNEDLDMLMFDLLEHSSSTPNATLRDDELMHYGRKGMKWYQNIFTSGKKSGSKKRGDSDDDAGTPTKAKTKSSSTTKKKSVKEMSDTELSDAIRRLEMERRYRELTPQQVSKGKAFTNSVVNKMILPAAEDVGRQLVKTFLVDQVNKGFGFDDEEHKVYTNNKKKK